MAVNLYSFGSSHGSHGRALSDFEQDEAVDAYRFWGSESDQIADAKAKAQTLSDEALAAAGRSPQPLEWKPHMTGVLFASGFGPVVHAWEIWTKDSPQD